LLAVITVLCSHAAHAQSHTVVAIFGGGSRTPVYEAYNQVLLRAMAPPSGSHVEYFEEYLDNGRFPDAADERRHAEFLRSRYAGKRIDLLISVDPVAVRFLLKFRDEAFPGVPVVFMGVRSATLARLALPADFIGIPHELDPAPTLRMGLALRPETREVVVVTGTATLDRGWEAAIRAVPLPAHVHLRVLTGLPIAAIERELAGLGKDAIVVTAAFRRDGAGQTFPGSMHVVERLSPISTAPIFHMYDTGVGHGAVGSFAVPQEALAAEAGEIARQLLEGRAVGAVTLPRAVEPVPIVDWRELRRWGMDEARLPPGTVVRFREAGFWAQYPLPRDRRGPPHRPRDRPRRRIVAAAPAAPAAWRSACARASRRCSSRRTPRGS
jgi:hypothetical protein